MKRAKRLRIRFFPGIRICFIVPSFPHLRFRIRRLTDRRVSASFTIEASMAMAVVLFALSAMIRGAYTLHDQVTGAMILEEALENSRQLPWERAEGEADRNADCESFAAHAEAQGNPRLILGSYQVSLDEKKETVQGKATAGVWELEMEIKRQRAEVFLRRVQALSDMVNRGEADEDGGRIQTGNEPELSDP